MHNVRLTGNGSIEIINYTKKGSPFLHRIRIQPIVAKNLFGVNETISLLGTTTAEFDINNVHTRSLDNIEWMHIIETNDLTSLESSDADDRSWNSDSSGVESVES